MRCRALLLLLPSALAFELPFKVPNLFSRSPAPAQTEVHSSAASTPRIAVIGAGAAGSSAAFWISKAQDRFGLDVQVDVYEKSDYVGGRSTVVYPYGNTSLPELELGGSIFVTANKNLWRASDEFGLGRRDFSDEDESTGIWDGQEMLLSFSGSWWDTAKLLWRYGFLSPRRTENFVRALVDKYLTLYNSDSPKWDSVADLSATFGWTDFVNKTALEHLRTEGVSDKYINEVVDAATRVNYGQDVDYIHALEGALSMAANGAVGIAGGNFQIFEKFLNHSRANVYLKTPVVSIAEKSSSSHLWSVKSSSGTRDYRAVILAAPFHQTGIAFPPAVAEKVPPLPYLHLHVTLLATTAPYLNATYFGLPEGTPIPRMLLTSGQAARVGGKKPEFNSISYHGLIRDGEWAVKIFSDHALTDEWLAEMFQGQVGWVLRKEWDAYPKVPPTSTFPPVKLDRGLYYVNAFEPFISTMETETVASRNVVDLMLSDEFNSGICGRTISAVETDASEDGAQKPLVAPARQETTNPDNFVLGWDC